MRYMSVGDKVLVHIPAEDRINHRCLMQYHEQTMKIADRRSIRRSKNNYVYYELVGAESKYGIPYGFIKEWLIQL